VKIKIKINRERLLLIALVATAFFGFVLWTNWQIINEEEAALGGFFNAASFILPRNKFLEIDSPRPNTIIKSPLRISGRAASDEGRLKARLKDSRGMVLGEYFFWVKNDLTLHPFSIDLTFKKLTSNKGALEVFQAGLKDNSETYKISLPLRFQN